MEQINDTVMNDEETDQLLHNVNKPKEEISQKGSFKEYLLSPDNTSMPLDFDCNLFNNISLDDEKSNPKNHPNFIPITT